MILTKIGMPVTTRIARSEDLNSITEIYNEAVSHTTATFDTTPKNPDEQEAWFAHHNEKYPVVVADSGGRIVGWASLSQWSDRCAYSDTAEISLYVRADQRGKGIGKKLMDAVLAEGQKGGLHTVIARIVEGNEMSVHIHQAFGFESVGVMKEVGRKFGKLLDVHMMQKIYR